MPKLTKTQGSNQYSNIFCGIQDKKANIWFGTSGEGLYRYDGHLFTQFTTQDGLNSNYICSVLEDASGTLWVGTREGLSRLDGKRFATVTIKSDPFSADSESFYFNNNSKSKTVWSIFQDKAGKIWFGTGGGVYCYDGKGFSRFLDDPNVSNKSNLHLSMIDCILEDNSGVIWFASGMPPGEEGICPYDGKNLVNFKPKNEGWFRKIMMDARGNLLLASRIHGLLTCDLSAANITVASFSEFDQPKELLNNSLTTILNDQAGNVWIASDYGNDVGDTLGGVWRCKRSPAADKMTYTKITNKEAFFILQDRVGHMWIGTRNTGLYCYDGENLTKFSD